MNATCTATMTASGNATFTISHNRSVISAMTRNSDSATLPRSSIVRCDSPIHPCQSSRFRMPAATSIAPM